MQLEIEIPKEFKVLFDIDRDLRHIVLYGGRASGKSTSVAIDFRYEQEIANPLYS